MVPRSYYPVVRGGGRRGWPLKGQMSTCTSSTLVFWPSRNNFCFSLGSLNSWMHSPCEVHRVVWINDIFLHLLALVHTTQPKVEVIIFGNLNTIIHIFLHSFYKRLLNVYYRQNRQRGCNSEQDNVPALTSLCSSQERNRQAHKSDSDNVLWKKNQARKRDRKTAEEGNHSTQDGQGVPFDKVAFGWNLEGSEKTKPSNVRDRPLWTDRINLKKQKNIYTYEQPMEK